MISEFFMNLLMNIDIFGIEMRPFIFGHQEYNSLFSGISSLLFYSILTFYVVYKVFLTYPEYASESHINDNNNIIFLHQDYFVNIVHEDEQDLESFSYSKFYSNINDELYYPEDENSELYIEKNVENVIILIIKTIIV